MVHLTTGDVNAARLRDAELPGVIVAYIDALHEGPTPAGVEGAAWVALRARFAAEQGFTTYEDAYGRLDEGERALATAGDHDEVVVWVEHDLLCQLALIRLLDALASTAARPAPERRAESRPGASGVSVVCIGAFPGIEPFRSLGQLTAAQVRGLFPMRRPVAPEVAERAHLAWAAFRAADPRALERMLGDETCASADPASRTVDRRRAPAVAQATRASTDAPLGDPLTYLAPALRRHIEQFPSVEDGVSRTERAIVAALAAEPLARSALFHAAQASEDTPFMTDLIFFGYVRDLARGPAPLVTIEGDEVALTAAGRDVLARRADAIALRGIDRWLGGVRLDARAGEGRPVWRWNDAARRLEMR